MARLPRYQRLGARTRQPQGVDFAGYREQARSAQALSSAVEQMSGFLYKQAQVEAQERGLERVRNEGAQPLLEAMQEQGGPRGLEERTAYEAANRIAVAEIASEAELEITKILDDGQANKQSFSAIQAKLKDVSDGFPAALSNIDPVSAGLLRARLQESTGKAELRYSKWWTGEITKRAKEKQNMVAANEAEFILGNAAVPGYERAAIDDDVAKGSQTLLDLGVEPNKVEEWAKGITQEAYKQNFLFDYNQRPIAEKNDLMQSLLSGDQEIEGMTYEQTVRFVNGLLRPEYNRNLAAVRAQSDFVVNKTEELEDILESGGSVSQDDLMDLLSKSTDVSELDGGAALGAYNQLQSSVAFFDELKGYGREELESFVTNLSQGISGAGGEGIDTEIEVQRYEQAEKFLSNMVTQTGKNPMDYAHRTNFIERQEIFGINQETGEILVNEQALNQRIQDAQSVAARYNIPKLKPLFSNEARILSSIFEKANTQGKIEVLSALAMFNNAAGEVLTQIADIDPSMALMGALVNQGVEEPVLLALSGKERIDAGLEPMGYSDSNVFPVFNEVVGQSLTQIKHQGAVMDLAKLIYTEKVARKGITVKSAAGFSAADAFDADVMRESIQLALGQQEIGGQLFGGAQEVRGIQVFLQPGMQAQDIETFLDNLSVEKIERMTGQTMEAETAAAISGIAEDADATDPRRAVRNNFSVQHIGGDKYKIVYHDGELIRKQMADVNGLPIVLRIGKDFISDYVPSVIPTPKKPQPDSVIGVQIEGAPKGTTAEIREDEPPTGEFIGAREAIAPEVTLQKPRTVEPGQTLAKDMILLEQSLRSQLQDTSTEQVRKDFNRAKVRKIRAAKDNQLNALFQDEALFTATRSERKEYGEYLTDAVRDDSVTKMKTFAEWKASQ